MNEDQTPDEFMKELFPGSKTFPVKLLCPFCGWHFKQGLTDIEGNTGKLVPGIALVCGQCLHMLQTNEKLELVELTEPEFAELDEHTKHVLVTSWKVAYINLLIVGPEPKETKQ